MRSPSKGATSSRPSGRSPSRTSARPATSSVRSGTAAAAATATSRSRSTRGSPSRPQPPTPRLAFETEATYREAMRLHDEVDKPNLMVKIPGTKPGLAAIEDVIAKGRSINVTLIFSLGRYAEVAESYIRGIERLIAEGGDPRAVASVASFFVSRIDTEADRRLDEIGGHEQLKGKLAIANAKLAYQHYRESFPGPRWEFLAAQGP